ncbi:hypothetical protein ES705_29721 [subsurface metagenome]
MREKYQRPFKVTMRAIQGRNIRVAMDMLRDEMTERVKKIKKREKEREKKRSYKLIQALWQGKMKYMTYGFSEGLILHLKIEASSGL